MSKRDWYKLWLIVFIVFYLLSILSVSLYFLPKIIDLTKNINLNLGVISTIDSTNNFVTGKPYTVGEKAIIIGKSFESIFKYKPERFILIRNYIITFLMNPIWVGIAIFGVLLIKTKTIPINNG